MNVFSWLSAHFPASPRPELVFLNQTRAYSETKNCVTFWGFDKTFEISFDLSGDELQRISPHEAKDESSILRAFDVNRTQIERMAVAAHASSRQRRHRLPSPTIT